MRFQPIALVALAACGAPQASPLPPQPPVAPAASSALSAPVPVVQQDAAVPDAAPPSTPQIRFSSRPVPLPGATGVVSLDYLACERSAGRVWIPAGNTASVDVLDIASGKLSRIEGFTTKEVEARGKKRQMGPSSATVGEGFVYVGNRADSQVCAIDAAKLVRGDCITLATPPDGLQYVATTHEVWVTTPRDKSITILDASKPAKLKAKGKIALDGEPEGYAVDNTHGVFYTNLEDKDKTLVIDVRARKVTATWEPQCGSEGPRGLALDVTRGLLFVACTDRVETLDAAHAGALLSKLDTGGGVDNIDYLDSRQQLYVAAGKAGTLSVAHVGDQGVLTLLANPPGADGARVVVVDGSGTAYLADPKQGRILVLTPSP